MTREEAIKILGLTPIKTVHPDDMSEFLTAIEIAVDALKNSYRRHGEWLGTVCSCCGESTSFYYDCTYCPHCGAEMDGGTENE